MGRIRVVLACVAILAAIGAGGLHFLSAREIRLPPTIAAGNGRLEAARIGIASKVAGRVLELMVDEGDLVEAGQPLARLDTAGLEADLRKAEAEAQRANRGLAEIEAQIRDAEASARLAQQELARATALQKGGNAAQSLVDQRRAARQSAEAALAAAQARLSETEAARASAEASVARIKVDLGDAVLRAPKTGRIQYRLTEPGEVVAAGASVLTLLDVTDVYMSVFLPTAQAGQVNPGAEAILVLDARPDLALPAKVTFVSPTAQFTPKSVETRSERDKLMFRIKVAIEPALLARHGADVRTGLPGTAYIKLDPKAVWPASLQLTRPN